ncbi:H+-transporting ATPase [Oxalobacteraceae bacterium GrIS 2.11]
MGILYNAKPSNETSPGLSDAQVAEKLLRWGPNAVPDVSVSAFANIFNKFWSPVPWMLEAAILFQLVLGEYTGASVVFALLMFNAILGYSQQAGAQKTLSALQSRLALQVSVRRNQVWISLAASALVPGDCVRLALGQVVAADVQILDGSVQVDQSMLTGESQPVDAQVGAQIYASSLVQRGQATAVVIATGAHTKFGRTAELLQTAHSASSQEKTVMQVVRNLALFNGGLILLMVLFAHFTTMSNHDIIQLVLTAILAAIPVALPATFTLAAAIGAKALARLGVLPTRLSAVDEAASMNVLCLDKTGTLTCNALTVNSVHPASGFDTPSVLHLAALASSDSGADPVDVAIRLAADGQPATMAARLTRFIPFDPATKMAQATITLDAGVSTQQIVKGAFVQVAQLIQPTPDGEQAQQLEQQGFRVLAVAAEKHGVYQLCGLIVLTDPPRADAARLIAQLRSLGISTVMVTGDAPATAEIVAQHVGLTGASCAADKISIGIRPDSCAIFAGVLPEDKYNLVKLFQDQGNITGMCGDGANDAPALRMAQIGIAVSTATDVAKSAAGIVLTRPGLRGIVDAVREGRIAFQRILTYTLNSMTKKVVQILFLLAGLLFTGQAILTPMLIAIVMITGDFLGMALTTDNVRGSSKPNVWAVGKLTIASVVMGLGELLFCVVVLWIGLAQFQLKLDALRTLAFVTLVFANQGTTYNNRARSYLWTSRPGNWLLLSSLVDIGLASTLALLGIAMTPIAPLLIAATLGGAIVYTFLLDMIKVPLFSHLNIADSTR